MQHKYIRRYDTGHHELFDLVANPGETRHVSGHSDCADVQTSSNLLRHLVINNIQNTS